MHLIEENLYHLPSLAWFLWIVLCVASGSLQCYLCTSCMLFYFKHQDCSAGGQSCFFAKFSFQLQGFFS